MAVVVISKVPEGTPREAFEAVSKDVDAQNNPPPGLLVHTAVERQGRIVVIDVWDSEQEFRTFEDQRLRPAIEKVMTDMGAPTDGPPPEQEVLEAFDLARGR
jgi:heme-degrading monooxygenase HmoA